MNYSNIPGTCPEHIPLYIMLLMKGSGDFDYVVRNRNTRQSVVFEMNKFFKSVIAFNIPLQWYTDIHVMAVMMTSCTLLVTHHNYKKQDTLQGLTH